MPHKIEYECDGNGVCYTDCPHGKRANVGSAECEVVCEHFVANNEEWNYVECKYLEGGGE